MTPTIRLRDVYQVRPVKAEIIEFLYRLIEQRMTEPEVNISATMPTMQAHRQFIYRQPFRCWYLIEVHRPDIQQPPGPWCWAGYISATDRNEIGIVLLKGWRNCGIGRAAVEKFLAEHQPLPAVPSMRRGRFVANINPANAASIALFTRLGGRHIQNTYEL